MTATFVGYASLLIYWINLMIQSCFIAIPLLGTILTWLSACTGCPRRYFSPLDLNIFWSSKHGMVRKRWLVKHPWACVQLEAERRYRRHHHPLRLIMRAGDRQQPHQVTLLTHNIIAPGEKAAWNQHKSIFLLWIKTYNLCSISPLREWLKFLSTFCR